MIDRHLPAEMLPRFPYFPERLPLQQAATGGFQGSKVSAPYPRRRRTTAPRHHTVHGSRFDVFTRSHRSLRHSFTKSLPTL
jgi:hypothetical protein